MTAQLGLVKQYVAIQSSWLSSAGGQSHAAVERDMQLTLPRI